MKLTLIDLEVHANVHEDNFQTSPAIDRKVWILPEVVNRQHLLVATFTDTYCRQVQDPCLVCHNGEPVPLQQRHPIQVEHGNYFKIVIPPDLWCEDPTHHLMEVAHEAELALQPQFQEEASDDEHDQLPLLQISNSYDENNINHDHKISPAPSHNDDDPLSSEAVRISVGSRVAMFDQPFRFLK